jgi:hypothetical protein
MVQRLNGHWASRGGSLAPGDGDGLVDVFAVMVGIRGWFEWVLDVG